MDQDLLDILTESVLGRDLTEEFLNQISEIAEECEFKKNSDIIKEGTPSKDLYIIKNGTVLIKLSLPTTHFNEQAIARMKSNDVFGEFSLVTRRKRSASVKAESDVNLYRFEYDKLIELFDSNYKLGYLFMRNIATIITHKIEQNHKLTRKMMLGL